MNYSKMKELYQCVCALKDTVADLETRLEIVEAAIEAGGGASQSILESNGFALLTIGADTYTWPVATSLVSTGSNIPTVTNGIAYFEYGGNDFEFPVSNSLTSTGSTLLSFANGYLLFERSGTDYQFPVDTI